MKASSVARAMTAGVVLALAMSGAAAATTPARTVSAASPAPGVTPSTIRVGYIYPDTENLPAGFTLPDTGSQVDQAKAFVDDLNQRGGINGRKVELKTYKFGLTADALADMRAKCLKATEDDKVFAVLTPSFFADPVLCVTQQHKTPMILGGGTTQEVIEKSKGRSYLTNFSTEHAIQASVDPLVKSKALKGKKLAVLLEDTPGFDTAIKNGLVKPLAKHGISIDDKVTIGVDPGRDHAIPAAVQRLKSEGVDGVFLAVNAIFSSLFMQAAAKADYTPQYFASDLSENSTDILPKAAPKGQMDGALGTTWRRTGSTTVGQAPSAFDTKCNATYATSAGDAPAKAGTNLYGSIAGTVRTRRRVHAGRHRGRARTSRWPRSRRRSRASRTSRWATAARARSDRRSSTPPTRCGQSSTSRPATAGCRPAPTTR